MRQDGDKRIKYSRLQFKDDQDRTGRNASWPIHPKRPSSERYDEVHVRKESLPQVNSPKGSEITQYRVLWIKLVRGVKLGTSCTDWNTHSARMESNRRSTFPNILSLTICAECRIMLHLETDVAAHTYAGIWRCWGSQSFWMNAFSKPTYRLVVRGCPAETKVVKIPQGKRWFRDIPRTIIWEYCSCKSKIAVLYCTICLARTDSKLSFSVQHDLSRVTVNQSS